MQNANSLQSHAPGRARIPVSRASKAPGAGLGTRRRTGLSSQQVVWAPEVPPGPLLFHEKKDLNLHPSKCQVPSNSWVDWWEADEKSDGKKLPELGLNEGGTHVHTHAHYTNATEMK